MLNGLQLLELYPRSNSLLPVTVVIMCRNHQHSPSLPKPPVIYQNHEFTAQLTGFENLTVILNLSKLQKVEFLSDNMDMTQSVKQIRHFEEKKNASFLRDEAWSYSSVSHLKQSKQSFCTRTVKTSLDLIQTMLSTGGILIYISCCMHLHSKITYESDEQNRHRKLSVAES